jgi:hypothetical protein
MATQKGKDGGPESQTHKQGFVDENDVEGHKNLPKGAGPDTWTNKGKDGGPESARRMPSLSDDDSVEGHKLLPK